jgi:hypothetical protein
MKMLAGALIGLSLAAFAAQATASDYAFRLHNRAEGYTINGFYTYQNGRWSPNWLRDRIRPGQSVPMDWNSNEGNCVVPFRVSWDDWGAQDFKLDWCTGVRNVYMNDSGFSHD